LLVKNLDFPVVAPTMTTLSLIQEAIMALKERTGSSVVAINKYLETEKKVRCL
jgi:linker histone H1 and H5 family